MKKRITLKEDYKHCVKIKHKEEEPLKRTVAVLQQFARVYSVEKCNDGALIGLILN